MHILCCAAAAEQISQLYMDNMEIFSWPPEATCGMALRTAAATGCMSFSDRYLNNSYAIVLNNKLITRTKAATMNCLCMCVCATICSICNICISIHIHSSAALSIAFANE